MKKKTTAFDDIMAGLGEALAIAKGEMKPAKLRVPSEIDVRGIRRKLKLSQEDFAATYGFTVNQIRDWEQGRSRPLGGVRAYLMLIDSNSEGVQRLLEGTRATRKAA